MIKLLTKTGEDSGYFMCDKCKTPSKAEYGECGCDVCCICKKRGAINHRPHPECVKLYSLEALKRVTSIMESHDSNDFNEIPYMLHNGVRYFRDFLEAHDLPPPRPMVSGIPSSYPYSNIPEKWRKK